MLNVVFPRGLVTSPKARAFVDFLVERLVFDTKDTDLPHRDAPSTPTAAIAMPKSHVGEVPETAEAVNRSYMAA